MQESNMLFALENLINKVFSWKKQLSGKSRTGELQLKI